MNAPVLTPGTGGDSSRRAVCVAGLAVVLATLAAYHNSFSGPFVFDDRASIVDNTTIRSLWPPGPLFSPPARAGLGGRPVFNITLALNYAAGGLNVGGYHALNLGIHLCAALALLGIVRRTALRRGAPNQGALFFGFATALIWSVHPLQTEAVTWISGRAESLMGMFYLFSLYAFIRFAGKVSGEASLVGAKTDVVPIGVGESSAVTSSFVPRCGTSGDSGAGRGVWAWLAVAACALGMATKEVAATAPLVVFLYDRTYVSGSFREAWRRRRTFYIALAATWLLLGRVVANARAQGVGLDVGGNWWAYALGESRAIVRYLRLSLWPHPLVFDYGSGIAAPSWGVLPFVAIVLILLAGSAWALFSKRAGGNRGCRDVGFVGACFFLILAPTSSVVAVAGQPVAEHRMYLPLAGVVVGVLGGIAALIGADARRTRGDARKKAALAVVALACIGATIVRNDAYRSALSLWEDTAVARPANERAQHALGQALADLGRTQEAIGRYQAALRLNPGYVEAHEDLGAAYKAAGRPSDAVAEFAAAVGLRPADPETHYRLGVALQAAGRHAEAADQFGEAIGLGADTADAEYNRGAELAGAGRMEEAIPCYEASLRLQSNDPNVSFDLANALAAVGRVGEAMEYYRKVLELSPDDAAAHTNLGIALAGAGRLPEAATHLREALRVAPARPDYHYNLGVILLRLRDYPGARAAFGRALEIKPDYDAAREQWLRLQSGAAAAQ